MKKTLKQAISMILCLILLAGMLPEVGLRAYAEDEDTQMITVVSEEEGTEADVENEEQAQEATDETNEQKTEEQSREVTDETDDQETEDQDREVTDETNDQETEDQAQEVADETNEQEVEDQAQEVTDETDEQETEESDSEEASEAAYPWDDMTDEEFAAYIYDSENEEYLRGLMLGEDEEAYDSFLTRLEQVEDEELYESLATYLSSFFETETASVYAVDSDSVTSRNDGTWLWPLTNTQTYYDGITDWAGCPGDGTYPCPFHRNNCGHMDIGSSAHNEDGRLGHGHCGLDIGLYASSVRPAALGFIYYHDDVDSARGRYVVIEHPIGTDENGNSWSYYSIYQHLQSIEKPVAAGEELKSYKTIGFTGGSGLLWNNATKEYEPSDEAYGIHLHFSILLARSGQGKSIADSTTVLNNIQYNSAGWITAQGYATGEIVENPAYSDDTEPKNRPGGSGTGIHAHRGSVYYTFEESEVSIGNGKGTGTSSSMVKQSYPCYSRLQMKNTYSTYNLYTDCSMDSDKVSGVTLRAGEEVTAIRLVQNKWENYWYRIRTASGAEGYVFAGHAEYVDTPKCVSYTGKAFPSEIKKDYFDVDWTITSEYLDIKSVEGCIYQAGADGFDIEKYRSPAVSVNSNRINLYGTAVDTSLKFNQLDVGGYYAFWVTAVVENNYSPDGETLKTVPYRETPISFSFHTISAGNQAAKNPITFYLQGGSTGAERLEMSFEGINCERGLNTIIFNTSGATVNTNQYGREVAVDASGKVIGFREYDDTAQIQVPTGGFVLSQHAEVHSGFAWSAKLGNYIGLDYANSRAYLYADVNGYLMDYKTVTDGAQYGALPVPTKEGYTFDGWYTAASGGTKITSSSTYSANKLYAHWTAVDPCASGHKWDEGRVTRSETCTQEGERTFTCTVCAKQRTEVITPHGHRYVESKQSATCITPEMSVFTCPECGDSYKSAHYSEWSTTRPSGVDAGLIESKMQYRYRTMETTSSTRPTLSGWTPNGNHTEWSEYGDWSAWSQNAVSQTDAVQVETTPLYRYYRFECPWCGKTNCYYYVCDCAVEPMWIEKFSDIPYTACAYVAIDSAKAYTTSLGDDAKWFFGIGNLYSTDIGTIDATGSDVIIVQGYRSRARTQNTVYDYYRWSDWSDWQENEVTASDTLQVETRTVYRYATGEFGDHTWNNGVITKAATCNAAGVRTYTCSTCKATRTEPIAQLTHSYTYAVTKAPTASAAGTLTGTCSKCNGTVAVTLPKLDTTNYTYTVPKAATCTAAGTGRYTWKTTTYGTFFFDVTLSKTGHTYTYAVTKAPTTTASGTLTGTCSKCNGTTTVTLPKLDTTNYTYSVTKQPTCTGTGTGHYVWKTTTYGSVSFDVTLNAKGHTEVTDPAVAATCTSDGLTAGKHCSVCNAVIEAQKPIAATGHSYTYAVTKAPTTAATGTLTGTCSACGGKTTVTLPKLDTTNYTYSVTKQPICTAAGTGHYVWKTTTYGSFSFDVTLSAKGHTEVTDPAVAATCTSAGKTAGKHCSVCNAVTVAQKPIAATGHSYTYAVTKAPTTAAAGTLTGTCSACGGKTTVTLPKLDTTNYTYSVTKQPTCTAAGTGRYVWKTTTYGSVSFDVTLNAKGHTEVTDPAVAATCTSDGLTAGKHCSVCNAVIEAQKPIAATGHSYTYAVTKAPTTAATGTLTGTCSACGGKTTVTLPKLDTTNYTYSVTKQPTCTAAGTGRYVWKTTTYGSFSFNVTVSAKGHTEVTDPAVAATCTSDGLTEGKHCSVCKTVIVAQKPVQGNHAWNNGVVTTPATHNAPGVKTYTCNTCGATKTEPIPQLTGDDHVDLAAPTVTTAKNVSSGVLVEWDAVEGAAGYVIYRRAWSNATGGWTTFARWNNTAELSFLDTVVYEGSKYQYGIKAYYGSDPTTTTKLGPVGPMSTALVFSRKPAATTATETANVDTGITISWTEVPGATGYVIYRRAWSSTTGGWTTFERWNNTTSLSFTDTKVYAGTIYQYGIKAYYGSDPKNMANVGPVGPLSSIVRVTKRTIKSAVSTGSRAITVKWDASGLFTGYQVQYSSDAAFAANQTVTIADKTRTSAVFTITQTGDYYIRVRSYTINSGTIYYGPWSETAVVSIS